MEMISPDGRSSFSLQILQRPTYEVLAAVKVSAPGFSGVNPATSYYWHEFEQFVAGLEEFSKQQLGEVRLDTMSPGEGAIRIFQLDRARHVAIEVQVGHGHGVRSYYAVNRVSITWELEPSKLAEIVGAFRAELEQAIDQGPASGKGTEESRDRGV
jgi:hypothetical protein